MSHEKPMLINTFCKGCGYCIEFCPKNVFGESEEFNDRGVKIPRIKEEAECIGCMLCAELCPEMAIIFKKEEEKVDE